MAAQQSRTGRAAKIEGVQLAKSAKLPYSFKKAITKPNTKKQGSCRMEVPMKDSRVCWEVGVRRELELVMKRPEDGKEEKWAVIWRSGFRMQRGDCILHGWRPFALHYKLVPQDVLAFTILNPALVSVLIVKRHHSSPSLGPPLSKIPRTLQQLEHKQLPPFDEGEECQPLEEPPLQLTNKALACRPPSVTSRRALCYVKVKPNHVQGDSLLLDIPPKFAEEVGKLAYGANEEGQHSRTILPIEKLVLDHEIDEGDLCIFELNVVMKQYTVYTLHVYVYKKDRGTPDIRTIALTKA